jgi:hypothetical protein
VGWKNGKRSVARQDATSLGSHKPLARSEDLIVEELGDEVLVYDSNVDVAHCLSPDAARVWQQCDGETPIETLTAQVGLSAERVEDALDELQRCHLLEQAPRLAGDGHTRRELSLKVAKVGAAAAAVPLIVSVSAPTPAQAGTIRFCAEFSSGNCGQEGSSGCQGTVGCCCCTPPLNRIDSGPNEGEFPESGKEPGGSPSPCNRLETENEQCKTCVPCQQQTVCQTLFGHSGNGCGAASGCPK